MVVSKSFPSGHSVRYGNFQHNQPHPLRTRRFCTSVDGSRHCSTRRHAGARADYSRCRYHRAIGRTGCRVFELGGIRNIDHRRVDDGVAGCESWSHGRGTFSSLRGNHQLHRSLCDRACRRRSDNGGEPDRVVSDVLLRHRDVVAVATQNHHTDCGRNRFDAHRRGNAAICHRPHQ